MIRLTPDDDAVWAHTLAALAASATVKPSLTIRCAACPNGTVLARVGRVAGFGPLFTSSWTEPVESNVLLNGEAVTRRQFVASAERRGDEVTERGDTDTVQGVAALLALPPEMAQDYPDLLVRCRRHGDLVLDRLDVLHWLGEARTRAVTPSGQRYKYVQPRGDGAPGGRRQRTTIVRRGKALPLDELQRRLRNSRDA